MKKLEKKQVPQFAALCVVSAGLFGYLVLRMVTPGSAAADTRPAPVPAPVPKIAGITPAPTGDQAQKPAGVETASPQVGTTPTIGTLATATPATASAVPATDGSDVTPPTPGMRDPFIPAYVDPGTTAPAAPPVPNLPKMGTQMASIKELPAPVSFPGAPALPTSLSSFPLRSGGSASVMPAGPAAPPLPSAPIAPPAWTVTGVLQGATEKIAVLRDGDNRRIVRSGEFVDSIYRVVGVSRTTVVLRHGTALYRLPLGGAKGAAGKPSMAPALPTVSVPTTVLPSNPLPSTSSSAGSAPGSAPVVPSTKDLPADLAGLVDQMAPESSTTNLPPATGVEASHG